MKITKAMPRKVCASLLIVGFMTTGCATVRIEEYGRRAMDEQRYRARNSHLEIAATPVLNDDDLANYFGVNLRELGILPIFVRLKNVDSSSSYIIGKEDVLVYEGSSQFSATSDAKVDSDIDAQVTVASALALVFAGGALGLGAAIAGGKMVTDAAVVEHNLSNKQFLTTTLAPDQEGSGFLYVKLPQEGAKLSSWNIRVNARNPNNNEVAFIELPLKWQ